LPPGSAGRRTINDLGGVGGVKAYFRNPGPSYGVFGYGGRCGVEGVCDETDGIGGEFSSSGTGGTGVYGYGRRFGVKGESDGWNGVGGVFKNNSYGGTGVHATGEIGVFGQGFVAVKGNSNTARGIGGDFSSHGTNSTGVRAAGLQYDFVAAGPGIDYHSASSIRWKSDIQVIKEPLEKILRLRGVCFMWDAEHGGGRDVGMIAEEVGEVLPEIVRYEEDGKYASGMDYSRLTPLLVEAVKALRSENQELKKRIEALERAIPENPSRQTEELQYSDGLRDTVK
jgi:hypothetical protein